MKVHVELSEEYRTPCAVIYADAVTEEVQRALELLGASSVPLAVQREERTFVLRPEEVFMVRIEGGVTAVYTERERFSSRKRLYELMEQLGPGFQQISKQTAVKLSRVKSVEAEFSGALLLRLKNGLSDYVSRRYQPGFKKALGL